MREFFDLVITRENFECMRLKEMQAIGKPDSYLGFLNEHINLKDISILGYDVLIENNPEAIEWGKECGFKAIVVPSFDLSLECNGRKDLDEAAKKNALDYDLVSQIEFVVTP